mgnify:CR=1 FL=1
MAQSPLYNSSLVNLYRSIGNQMGVSPAFVNASIAQGISESSLDPKSRGDGGKAFGLHQWHPDRQRGLLALSKQMGLPPTDPRVQIPFWYNENKSNWSISDPTAANNAAIASERPAGWKPGDPTGVPSYNKRLGDTMALMRMQAGQPDTQDPNSFMAMAPEGADGSPQATVGPQSVSLGDDQQQPFDNIGSTLANVGAAIASLDSQGTGIASLNASRVAQNLSAQESMRERQGGWKYAGQTQNGQGLIFQNSKGEVRVEPLAPGLAGPDQGNLPSSVREFEYRKKNPDYANYMDNKDKLEPSLSEDTQLLYAMRAIKGDNTWTKEIGGDKQGSVDKRAIDEKITDVARDLKMTPDDIMKARTEQRYRQKVADRIALIDVNTETAANKINAAATNLIETSKKYPRGDIRFLEGLKQKWDEQTNDPNLQSLKTAVDAFALDYATALNPQKTSPTVDDVRNARNKILTTMNQESLEAAVNIVQREIGSIRQNSKRTHDMFFGSTEEQPKPTEGSSPAKRLKYNPATGELE